MKKIFFILLFLSAGIQFTQAQKRIGLQLGYVPVTTLELDYLDKNRFKVTNFPQVGIYYQRWVSDRRFVTRSLVFENFKMIDNSPGSEFRRDSYIRVLHYFYGYGFYLNHKEFEDDFASYITPSVGLGVYRYKETEYAAGSTKGIVSENYWSGVLSFSLGYGVEKSLNRKWLLNASVDGHMQMYELNPFYVSISCRLLYRAY